jgi:primosomal protein DnaI
MMTYKFNKDTNAASEFVKEIQAKLPKYNVTISNVNDFDLMIRERENCRKCRGLSNCQNDNKGHYTSYENDEFVLTECKHKRDSRIINDKSSLIKTLYLPNTILNAKFEEFHITCDSRRKLFEITASFINDYKEGKNPKGLYLLGSFSKGKTYTLGCIANELAKNNIKCLLIYFPDLVVDLKNAVGTPRFGELVNMLKSIDVLMLDDLGSEKMTEWIRDDILGPIINYRLMENKPLFISSNLKMVEYQESLILNKDSSDRIKAERIMNRITGLVRLISMDDSNTYKR